MDARARGKQGPSGERGAAAATEPSSFPTVLHIPASAAGERAVLGAVLSDPNCFYRVTNLISTDDFYNEAHRTIFAAFSTLANQNRNIDILTTADQLQHDGGLAAAGGLTYLASLAEALPDAANVEHYAEIVRDRAVKRQLLAISQRLLASATSEEGEAMQALVEAETQILGVAEKAMRGGLMRVGDLVTAEVAHIERVSRSSAPFTGLETGFYRFDELTSGLQKQDLIILAARPGVGKTALALNVAANCAIRHGARVAVFSLEMSSPALIRRLLAAEARINMRRLAKGLLKRTADPRDHHRGGSDWQRLAEAADRLADAPLWIDDTAAMSILELRGKCRRHAMEHGLDLVVVDYLQLMSGGARAENRTQEVSAISRGLKAVAKQLDVPLLVLSQLSRNPERRGDQRPQLSDLRESGCLAGDTVVTVAETGERVPIRDLAGRSGFSVWTTNPKTLKLERGEVTHAFSTGTKPLLRLTTRSGRRIDATANHRFLGFVGWCRLGDLRPGDNVALPRAIPSAGNGAMSSEELALLGHLLGDGCTLPRHAIQYSTRDRDLADLVQALAGAVFNNAVEARVKQERTWFQVYLSSTRHHTHGVRSAVSEWLDGLGAWGLRSHEKHVPEAVYRQDEKGIATFLRHLWATDGCARLRGGKKTYPAVYYATSSERLGRDVQALLLRVGIVARLARVPQGSKGRDQYHVIVNGRPDLLRFVEVVGAVGATRQALLDSIGGHLAGRGHNTNRDVIPKEAWNLHVIPTMARRGITHRALHTALGMAYCGMTLFKQNMSRERALRVAEAIGCRELAAVSSSDLYWDTVVSVEAIGEQEVFDLTVPRNHCFVANDLVVHNSIEQDADVVLFINRKHRGQAPPETPEEEEELRMAEIMVAKQRNGPTDMFKLVYFDEFTRFENPELSGEPG